MKTETIEEFKARGGSIKRLDRSSLSKQLTSTERMNIAMGRRTNFKPKKKAGEK